MHPRMGRCCRSSLFVVALSLMSLTIGCASPQADVSSCEQDKAALLATIRQQRDEVNSLRERTASLERRLSESETEIARLDPTRQVRGPVKTSESDGLSWRSPAEVRAENENSIQR